MGEDKAASARSLICFKPKHFFNVLLYFALIFTSPFVIVSTISTYNYIVVYFQNYDAYKNAYFQSIFNS